VTQSFFGWWVREKLIARNPVTAKVPHSSEEPVEMKPFTEQDLEGAHQAWRVEDPHLADVLLVMAWTGIRWCEARAVTARGGRRGADPGPAHPPLPARGVATKSTKGRRSRRVPLADRVMPMVRRMQVAKEPGELLLTTRRRRPTAPLSRAALGEVGAHGQGRRVHDLRHTAACLWLACGVDPGTVQAWMGHESIAPQPVPALPGHLGPSSRAGPPQ
jgi:integrase